MTKHVTMRHSRTPGAVSGRRTPAICPEFNPLVSTAQITHFFTYLINIFQLHRLNVESNIRYVVKCRHVLGADKSLALPGRKQATATKL